MGRPLNKKYFANTNYAADGEGVGGEKLATVVIAAPIAASLNAVTTTVSFSAPQIQGGQTATGTAVIDDNGDLTGIDITNAGSGYTAVPTVIVVDSDNEETLTLTSGSGGVTLTLTTTARQNGIVCQAITAGSTNRTSGNDIIKQVGSKRFKVRTVDGTAVCTLTASTPDVAGEMAIVATDSDNGTYFVTKITKGRATLTAGTGTQFATGKSVPWTFGDATVDVSVKIPNA